MSEVVVVVVAQAKPGRGEDALAAFQGLAAQTHAEEGCRLFALHRAPEDPSGSSSWRGGNRARRSTST